MSHHFEKLLQWETVVSSRLSNLSKSQARKLALYSLGVTIIGSCGLSQIALLWSIVLVKKANTMRHYLRELLYDKAHKKGEKRRDVAVESCFGFLLGWIVDIWATQESPRIAIALDATNLGDRFVVLCISVMYRHNALPIAWKVLPADQAGSWRPHWIRLLKLLDGHIPDDWTVIALTDRGLYAKWLFEAIQANGWHPMMRINTGGKFRPCGHSSFRPLKRVVPKMGTIWYGEVECFSTQKSRVRCTLLAQWDYGCRHPWLILTDLPPQATDILWYARRMWIEHGFRFIKRGMWHWEQTKIVHPERAERLWLVLSLACLYVAAAQVPVSDEDRHALSLSSQTCTRIWLLATNLMIVSQPIEFCLVDFPWSPPRFNPDTITFLSQGGYPIDY